MAGIFISGDAGAPASVFDRAKDFALNPAKYIDMVEDTDRRTAAAATAQAALGQARRDFDAHQGTARAEHAEREKRIGDREREMHDTANEQAAESAHLRGERQALTRAQADHETASSAHTAAVEAAQSKFAAERRDLDAYKARLDDRDKDQVKRAEELEQAEEDMTRRQAAVARREEFLRAVRQGIE